MAFGKSDTGKIATVIVNTVIGTDVRIRNGEISGDGDMVIAGKVDGNIIITGSLVIEGTGSVNGDITASTVFVSGTVEGNINAGFSKIEIYSTGSVFGDMACSSLQVEDGGHFEGSCKVTHGQSNVPLIAGEGKFAIASGDPLVDEK